MLTQLANLYEVEHQGSNGKAFVSALTGSTLARIGASMVKSMPGIGTAVGTISMPVLSGASTYAVGKVAIDIFEGGGDLLSADLDSAKEAYKETFEQGKRFVSDLGRGRKRTQDVLDALGKLGELKEKSVITQEEFELQKQKLLNRL